MKRISAFCIISLFLTSIKAQDAIGVGTLNPQAKLHVFDGGLRLESAGKYLDIYSTSTSLGNGMRFYSNGNFAGGWFYRAGMDNLNLTNNANVPGLVFDLSTNLIGINELNPLDDLHLTGDFRIDDPDPFIKFYDASTYKGFIQHFNADLCISNRLSGYLYLRTNNLNRVSVNPSGMVGIGTSSPTYLLHSESNASPRSFFSRNTYSSSASKYAGYFDATSSGTGNRYGVYTRAEANPGNPTAAYGLRSYASGNNNSGSVYGVLAEVASSGTGNRYALFASAPTPDPSSNTKSWAVFASGNSYFSNDVRIGWTDDVAGYLLAVDGKIISEEVKVQLSSNWPDYVFQEDYVLPSLEELRLHIRERGHLPGVPSAEEVSINQGFELGEMNRILLEKIEELTLYILEQEERLDRLEISQGLTGPQPGLE